MDIGIIGIFIPILALMIPIVAIWTKHQQKMAEMQVDATAQNTAERAAQYASHVKELEDRVRVLERIVTDQGYNVATQIEALREAAPTADSGNGVLQDAQKERA